MSHAALDRRVRSTSLRSGFPLAAATLACLGMAAFYAVAVVDARLVTYARLLAFPAVVLASYRRRDWRPGVAYVVFFATAFVWQAEWAAMTGSSYADIAGTLTTSFLLLAASLVMYGMATAWGRHDFLMDTARERRELLERADNLDQVAAFVCDEALADLGGESAGLLVRNPIDERWEFFTSGAQLVMSPSAEASPVRLARWLAERNDALVIDDLWTDERFMRCEGFRSLLSRPLRDLHGDLLAVLVLTHSRPGVFGPEDLPALDPLAESAETALRHASAYERAGWASERLAGQLAAIQRTARDLNAELEPEAIAGRTLDCAIQITGASAGAIQLDIEGLHPLVRSTTGGISDHLRQLLIEAAQTGRPSLVARPEPGLLDPPAGSRLVVPVRREATPFGAVVLEKVTAEAFNHQDVQAITSLASHAAVALENARLFRQIRAEREKSQQIVQNIADGVLTLDAKRHVTSVNPAAERLLGQPAQAVLGHTLCEILTCGLKRVWAPARG